VNSCEGYRGFDLHVRTLAIKIRITRRLITLQHFQRTSVSAVQTPDYKIYLVSPCKRFSALIAISLQSAGDNQQTNALAIIHFTQLIAISINRIFTHFYCRVSVSVFKSSKINQTFILYGIRSAYKLNVATSVTDIMIYETTNFNETHLSQRNRVMQRIVLKYCCTSKATKIVQ